MSLKLNVCNGLLFAARASAALQECIDWKLTGWGVDPKFWAALRSPPIDSSDVGWLTGDDYPTDALDANAMGHVIARLNVNAAGKVTDCKVVVSSGRPSLNEVTCSAALKRAKYLPAIGPNGQPTNSPRIVNVSWMIEG